MTAADRAMYCAIQEETASVMRHAYHNIGEHEVAACWSMVESVWNKERICAEAEARD